MSFIEQAFFLIVVLGILVFIHEAGHFVAAKLFGVGVETFSLGFGKRLVGFRRGDTDYRISMIPLGGYVKMVGEFAGEGAEEKGWPAEASFNAKPRWQRLIIMVAGPAMNIVLAVVIYWALFMVGSQVPDLPEGPPLVEAVQEGSAAAQAGIQPGDRILKIGDEPIDSIEEYGEERLFRPGQTVTYVIDRDGNRIEKELTLGEDPIHGVGQDGVRIGLQVVTRKVSQGSPAEEAGVKAGDRIVAVDGRPAVGVTKLSEYIGQRPGEKIDLQVLRDDRELTLTVVPEEVEEGRGRIGVVLSYATRFVRYGPLEAMDKALAETWRGAGLLFRTLHALVTREIGVDVVSGPLEIARISRDQAEYGLAPFLQLLAFISLNLGIFNLLPVPVLDGGNILILLIESGLRRDLSMTIKERILQIGLVLLVAFAILVISLDIKKLISRTVASEGPAVEQQQEAGGEGEARGSP
jgi:regulator of sigma E protease